VDEAAVRARISRLLRSGDLPGVLPERCLGGPGSGRACAACTMPIPTSAFEIEIDERFVLHPNCYLVWIAEVKRWRREQRDAER
jgi:hypothetical protein